MASEKTVRKTIKVLDRLTQIFGPEMRPPSVTMFDREGKIVAKWKGRGPLVEARKKGPGTMEKIYRELPCETLLRFIVLANTPEPEPTQKEWQEFEYKLFTAARRVTIRQAKEKFKKLSKGLPEPAKRERGRPPRKEGKIKIAKETVQGYLDSGECKTKTAAVRKAAEALARGRGTDYCEDTIWRYLRAAKQAKHSRRQPAKPSAR